MHQKSLLAAGLVATGLAALCCATPVLVLLLGGVGLSAAIGYLDYVLLPALLAFAALTTYALWRRDRKARGNTGPGSC